MCIAEIINLLLQFTHILVQLRCMSWKMRSLRIKINAFFGMTNWMVFTTDIFLQLKCISWKQKLYESKCIHCLAWSIGSSWIYILWCKEKISWKTYVDTHLRVKNKILQTNEFSCTVRSQRKVDNKTIT